LDLRGHGASQGAFRAVGQESNPLPALADDIRIGLAEEAKIIAAGDLVIGP
jgi:hypothetical protein